MVTIISYSFIGAVQFGTKVKPVVNAYTIDPVMQASIDESMAELEQFFIDKGTTLAEQQAKQTPPIELYGAPNIITHPIKYIPYLLTVLIAVETFFEFQGYTLALELLHHAWENTSLNSSYKPLNADRLLQVSKYTNEIAYKTNYETHNVFPHDDNLSNADYDAYYALRKFNYKKVAASSTMVKIRIQDKYDYEADSDYDGVGEAAIQLMYLFQEVDFLTPYYVDIVHTIAGVPFNNYPTVNIINGQSYYVLNCGSALNMAGTLPLTPIKQFYGYNEWKITINSDGTYSFSTPLALLGNYYITAGLSTLDAIAPDNYFALGYIIREDQKFNIHYIDANRFYLVAKGMKNNAYFGGVPYAQNDNEGSYIKMGFYDPNNYYQLWQLFPA